MDSALHDSESTQTETEETGPKKPKTSAQRQKEFRERKKQKHYEANSIVTEKIPREKPKRKTKAQVQKEYRERLKKAASFKKLPQEIKIKKSRAQVQKEYRERLKHEANLKKIPQEITIKKSRAQVQKEYRERLKNAKRPVFVAKSTSLLSIMPLLDDTQDNSFIAPYEQHAECATPDAILSQDIDIAEDGNRFFYSVIRIMKLEICPKNLRKQLLQSAYLHDCTDPPTAISVLQSDFGYAEYNCLFVFSREYNQYICVHFYYFDINIDKKEITFCRYEVDDKLNFIHLHLVDQHFTSYIENKNIEDVLLENTRDLDVKAEIDESCLSDNPASRKNNVTDIDETIPMYKYSKIPLDCRCI